MRTARVRTFLAASGNGLARATESGGGWSVEHVLPGLTVTCLVADPLDRRVVYAGTAGAGVLRSDDGGRTWRTTGLDGRIVMAVAVSPHRSGLVYAGTKPPMLFVSADGGATWSELAPFRRARRWYWRSPAEGPPFLPYVQAIALSPTDPRVILAGIEAGALLRSADGGRTWQGHRPGALRDCHSLIFHVRDGRWAYQGGAWFRARGCAFSRDAGESWTAPRDGIDRSYGWAVAADPERPEVWYVSVAPGPMQAHGRGSAQAHIYRSAGGAPWERLHGGLPQPLDHMPYALLTDPDAPGHLYAGLSNGDVWHSTNHGDLWHRLPLSLSRIDRALVML